MQFEKCLYCPAFKEGKCTGPNFMAMSSKELFEWGTRYQKIHGITNAQLAEWSGIPKGTIDGLKYRDDVRHDTIYRVLKALIIGVGCSWRDDSCSGTVDNSQTMQDAIKHLEEEITHLEGETKHLEDENHFLKESLGFTLNQIKKKNIAIISLTASLGIAFVALIVDLLVSHLKF